jgi:hypothetical protein
VDLQRLIGGAVARFRSKQLGHGRCRGHFSPLLVEPGGTMSEQPRAIDLRCHIGEHALDRLKIGDWLTELPALAAIVERLIQTPLRDAKSLRGDPDPAAVKSFERDLEPLALSSE